LGAGSFSACGGQCSYFEAEHEIYHDDAVLEYPQSGERIRGRRNIQASRFAQPNKKRFMVRREATV
jgi:hypothetical protein